MTTTTHGDPPAVSVLMPVYNGQRYLAEAVESILGQTFTDFEFIIIDDGSKDGSKAIIEGYAARDSRIRLVSRPNTGIVGALNEGLGLARAEYVARMDADDIAISDRLATQVKYLDEHADCVIVGSRVIVIDPDGQSLIVMTDMLTHEQIDQGLLAGNGASMYHPAVMFRRSVVLGIGAYRTVLKESEDLDLFLRLAEVGRVANIEQPLLKYREHLAKGSRARAVAVAENRRRIMEDAYRRRSLEIPASMSGPIPNPPTTADVYRTWSWWALGSGHVSTARKYALSCLVRTPFSAPSWKLLFCAIRGR